ncbi:MAG: DUF2116 family Zn-ribbon domain-containing protein [Halobacteria archaeon]|jgi:predicted nucleic acid-binding Zn ribbon protein
MKPLPHRHCNVCGKAVDSEEKVCSEECQRTVSGQRRRQRWVLLFFFAVMGSLLLMNLLAARPRPP